MHFIVVSPIVGNLLLLLLLLGAGELVVVERLGWYRQVLGSILAISARFTGSSFRGAPTVWRRSMPVSDSIRSGAPRRIPRRGARVGLGGLPTGRGG